MVYISLTAYIISSVEKDQWGKIMKYKLTTGKKSYNCQQSLFL